MRSVASGKPVKLLARWEGPPPAIGDYLQSRLKPRFSYRVISVAIRTKGRLELTADRIAPWEVPVGATIHAWQWESRGPGAKTRTAYSRA